MGLLIFALLVALFLYVITAIGKGACKLFEIVFPIVFICGFLITLSEFVFEIVIGVCPVVLILYLTFKILRKLFKYIFNIKDIDNASSLTFFTQSCVCSQPLSINKFA